MKYANILEEELKNKVAEDFFSKFDHTPIMGKIDFAVKPKDTEPNLFGEEYFLWAEAKKTATDIGVMLTQLVLTIGKEYQKQSFNKFPPPSFLGCFDREKIAFVPYNELLPIFHQNDFDWTVTPSNHKSDEFNLVLNRINKIQNGKDTYCFDFDKDEKELKAFIHKNFVAGKGNITKIQINKNNFKWVYDKWVLEVKPSINVNWDVAKKLGVLDGDFYIADLLSENNESIKKTLSVWLNKKTYKYYRQTNALGEIFNEANFHDFQKKHTQFWAKYERPPKEEYWDFIVERRDLLVPQDFRERNGAFFTPPQWVAKAHEYLALAFGERWQDEYYVWDNSAGTGNLLFGLVNKDNIWASTLDMADVDVMRDRIENGVCLWKEQVFQFDFLNDDFKPVSKGGKLPDKLFEIINDPQKRKKLIFLINPPYGEAGNAKTRARKGSENEVEHKAGVKESKMSERFYEVLGGAALNEKYIQFFARIYADVPDCKMAAFVTPKYICGVNMDKFRGFWKAKYLGGFATPATTHDNCIGEYPICLFIWDLAKKNTFPQKVNCDIFNEKEAFVGVKTFFAPEDKTINDWIGQYKLSKQEIDNKDYIGIGRRDAPDSQRNNYCWIAQESITTHFMHLNHKNLKYFMVYFAVRHCIDHVWIDDSDRYFFPENDWKQDVEFQNDCFAYTLFHLQNKIKLREGTNHWIPFTEDEVGCQKRFDSRFMSDYIAGKIDSKNDFFGNGIIHGKKLVFSKEAKAVLNAGLAIWKYYHSQKNVNVNAAFYDIREHFQGRKGDRMSNTSTDEKYNELFKTLQEKMKILAKKIEPKVYEYGFLKE
jgi:hypothetical protein